MGIERTTFKTDQNTAFLFRGASFRYKDESVEIYSYVLILSQFRTTDSFGQDWK